MRNWHLNDLEKWSDKIEKIAIELGLDFYPQEFEICSYHEMIGYEAYSGMPAHYPHWSYGKAYERIATMYKYGVIGLPYEMVINSNPCLAYLMADNSLAAQILTMAHVYGHNDFFKNNVNFEHIRREYVIDMFKLHADRIRSYIEDPGIGYEKVEHILDAAHAIAFQCHRYKKIVTEDEKELKKKAIEKIKKESSRWNHLKPDEKEEEVNFTRVPFKPDEDILIFIRDHQPFLEDWQKDIMTIVREETDYFLPQIETKILNEGWAVFVHNEIGRKLELPPEIAIEYLKLHNQVIRPVKYSLNPYYLGFKILKSISDKVNENILEIRKIDRDVSFLQRFLNEKLIYEFKLFEFVKNPAGVYEISEVADEEGWKKIKQTLIRNIGLNSIPVVKVDEVDFSNYELKLIHEHDGRELHMEYMEHTLKYIYDLWGQKVSLKTFIKGEEVIAEYTKDKGFILQTNQ